MRGIRACLAISVLAGCYSRGTDHTLDELPQATTGAPKTAHQAEVHRAYAELGMTTGSRGIDDKPSRVPCATCHAERRPADGTNLTMSAGPPHQGITVEHGGQPCQGCHEPPDYERFRRQSGVPLQYRDVMDLCAQCHGRQKRDFEHGAHGGMNGFWDLNLGPRQLNHCLDCHDPHKPASRQVEPAELPRYRFVEHPGESHE